MARIGQGTLLQTSTDGVVYTTIAELTEIGEIALGEGDDVDVTSHDSPDGYRQYTRGLVDTAEITFTGNWTGGASQLNAINKILAGPTTVLDYIKVVLPSSLGTFTSRGYVKTTAINPQLDDKIEFNGSLKLSGKPTLTVP